MIKKILSLVFIFSVSCLAAQPSPGIPFMRKVVHEGIDKTQSQIDKLDNKEDKQLNLAEDEEGNLQLAYTLWNKIDDIQDQVESDSTLDSNDKIKYLRGLNEVLSAYLSGVKNRSFSGALLVPLTAAYDDAIKFEQKGFDISPVIKEHDLETGTILLKAFPFQKNKGLAYSRELVLLKTCEKYPDRTITILRANPNAFFSDSLLRVVAKTQQDEIYNYAQSTNSVLSSKIRSSSDPLLKTIAQLARLNEGRMYFPFLDDLVSGKVSMDDLDKNRKDPYKYYRLLVNTEIDYTARLRKRDTPMAMNALTGMLRQKAVEEFINVINGLHDEPDNVRMRVVEPLNPQELYYLCVMGENEIYTSSYLKVYERIFQRMKVAASDTLLMLVNFDRFKKFIKMAANYNTLDNFLSRMDKENALILMKAFAGSLEKTNSLEDAVDVADSYASISDVNLKKLILEEVQANVQKHSLSADKRGFTIYDLLNTIFLSLDSASKVDISEKFGIPPIYEVDNKSLRNVDGKIIIQQFFYGDKDGMTVFNYFRNAYNVPGWKITTKAEWIEVSSTSGVPIVIYANKPLDEKQGLDEKAQEALDDYLLQNDLHPTVVIHRGHSYHVSSTIKQLVPSAKVVLLGSCGGYQNINKVLNICPYAHIIASKQVGSGTVNGPMIISITEALRQGKDLNWPLMWKDLGRRLKDNNLFEDYVPPYKNLGALFIMAYNKVMEG